jgi:hypothetical protein
MTIARRFTSLLIALGVGTVASSAFAANHDRGFYFRGGLGFGFVTDSFGSDTANVAGVARGKVDGSLSGFSGATELALGGAISDGLILGGGLYSMWFSPTAHDLSVTASVGGIGGTAGGNPDVDFKASSFHVLGPFLDYYFNEDKGFHLQGAIGLAILPLGDVKVAGVSGGGYSSTGFGFMIGLGNEWWVSRKFALGVLGRLTGGVLKGESDGNIDWSHTAFAPAVLMTATYN